MATVLFSRITYTGYPYLFTLYMFGIYYHVSRPKHATLSFSRCKDRQTYNNKQTI